MATSKVLPDVITPENKYETMSFIDFCCFMLSEEDKQHPASLRYWFAVLDADHDGVLSECELRRCFDDVQKQKMNFDQDVLPFTSYLSELLDMIGTFFFSFSSFFSFLSFFSSSFFLSFFHLSSFLFLQKKNFWGRRYMIWCIPLFFVVSLFVDTHKIFLCLFVCAYVCVCWLLLVSYRAFNTREPYQSRSQAWTVDARPARRRVLLQLPRGHARLLQVRGDRERAQGGQNRRPHAARRRARGGRRAAHARLGRRASAGVWRRGAVGVARLGQVRDKVLPHAHRRRRRERRRRGDRRGRGRGCRQWEWHRNRVMSKTHSCPQMYIFKREEGTQKETWKETHKKVFESKTVFSYCSNKHLFILFSFFFFFFGVFLSKKNCWYFQIAFFQAWNSRFAQKTRGQRSSSRATGRLASGISAALWKGQRMASIFFDISISLSTLHESSQKTWTEYFSIIFDRTFEWNVDVSTPVTYKYFATNETEQIVLSAEVESRTYFFCSSPWFR